jgi:hypothetical protein
MGGQQQNGQQGSMRQVMPGVMVAPDQPQIAVSPTAVVGSLAGTIISKVVMVAIDRVFMPEPNLTDLRSDMLKIVDGSGLGMHPAAVAVSRPEEKPVPEARVPTAAEKVNEALRALNEAKSLTKCKVCKDEITAATKEVEKRVSVVRKTDTMYTTMKRLETEGVLPKGSRWKTLKESEREVVRKRAKS